MVGPKDLDRERDRDPLTPIEVWEGSLNFIYEKWAKSFEEQLKGDSSESLRYNPSLSATLAFIGPYILGTLECDKNSGMIDELLGYSGWHVIHSTPRYSGASVDAPQPKMLLTFYDNRRLVEIASDRQRQATNSAAVKKLTSSPLALGIVPHKYLRLAFHGRQQASRPKTTAEPSERQSGNCLSC